jgi:hypothetical protein
MHGISDYSILPRERLLSCDGDVRVYLLPQTRYKDFLFLTDELFLSLR